MINKRWVQSFSGRVIVPTLLDPESVNFPDIAHALSLKCRFQGQCETFYSVAQHCVEGARQLPSPFRLAFLLHEVSEVYLPDIPGPMKDLVYVAKGGYVPASVIDYMTWADLEKQHTHAVLEALNLTSIEPLIYCPEVKQMDWAMLAAEKRDLCKPEPEDWNLPHPPPPGLGWLNGWEPAQAEREFTAIFNSLARVNP
jgi:hypothetical protein